MMFEEAALVGPPGRDEIEITLIGPGFGESVVVHLGGNEWMVVDCCTRGGNVLPLTYLDAIDVSHDQVTRVVATHWDLDHVAGLGRLVRACSPTLVVPAALEPELVLQYIGAAPDDVSTQADETQDAGQRFRLATQEFRDAMAAAPKHMYGDELKIVRRRSERDDDPDVQVTALSPCPLVLSDHVTQIARLSRQVGRMNDLVLEDYLANQLSRNDCSIALWVQVGNQHVLLGADLEGSGHPERGWNAVVGNEDREPHVASALKVPHHGSSGAVDPVMWGVLVADNVQGLLAPWFRGGRWLPHDDALEDLRGLAGAVWCSRLPPRSRFVPENYDTYSDEIGFVSLRAKAEGGDWRVTHSQCAVSVVR